MTTAFFQTTSNEVQITDPEAVEDILDDYEIGPQEVDSIFNGDTICIRTPEMPNNGFYVNRIADGEEDTTHEMLERLAEYLEEPLRVNTIQTEGAGDTDITVIVNPNGEIERKNNSVLCDEV